MRCLSLQPCPLLSVIVWGRGHPSTGRDFSLVVFLPVLGCRSAAPVERWQRWVWRGCHRAAVTGLPVPGGVGVCWACRGPRSPWVFSHLLGAWSVSNAQ